LCSADTQHTVSWYVEEMKSGEIPALSRNGNWCPLAFELARHWSPVRLFVAVNHVTLED